VHGGGGYHRQMTTRWETASLWAGSLRPMADTDRAGALARRWDVIVVGAGLAGLVTAHVLRQAGREVLVLDRHGVGGITTRGSTGKLTALQGSTLPKVADHRGQDGAAAYAAAALAGVAGLRSLIEELAIDCDLVEAPDHVYATEPDAADRCQRVLTVARASGLPVEWVEQTELPFDVQGAVRLDGQAHLDPGALCGGLAAALPAGSVLERTAVTDVEEDAAGVTVTVVGGDRVHGDHVVIATLGPIHDPALLTTRCEARRSYAIAAPHDRPVVGMYISLDEQTRSIRPARVADGVGTVVGGGGHVSGELGDRRAEDRWSDLEGFARDVLGTGPAAHRWVAHDLITSDHVPFIGRLSPRAQRRWVISGFQKWGIATSFVAGDLILGEMDGTARPWASLFDPRRIASSLTNELVQDGVRAVRHLVVERVKDLPAGRDRRPRCTHLGCVLGFDEAEQTWDCPCHGSRFAADGTVVSGPAVRDLDRPARPERSE
jgi:glycine/D-amino acid oxidase-like deaminating enzyme